ncbi:hypothetical protein CLV36_106147 [Laceyella sediminis]|uniref:Uncharacterized protein n=1 Tax=Laceyella sediminis TaxID=573074 RepID=A0ABX5EP04_9BACL|nr:hypothetical protein [Laceyella sediminis]PRZ14384.1 hypothetical protein CLV36_106147 [Laceyella sediminis]
MTSLWFHLIVIPGIFLLGHLTGSVKVAGFRTRTMLVKGKSSPVRGKVKKRTETG